LLSDLFPRVIALKNIQRYIPSLTWEHILTEKYFSFFSGPIPLSGVRAQAIGNDGKLIEDFIFEQQNNNILHVRNAPSPAATSSLTIAKQIVETAETIFQFKSTNQIYLKL
jgi:2-hydroxyglutarate dehydrogenase